MFKRCFINLVQMWRPIEGNNTILEHSTELDLIDFTLLENGS